MKTKIWMGSLAVGAALLGSALDVNAQYVQNAIGIPITPGCPAGESWTKNGVRYQCETPQPSCPYGFAAGPVWTGSSWSFSCNEPPPPPGGGDPTSPTQNANTNCLTSIAQAGYSQPSNPYPTSCSGLSCIIYNVQGPLSQPYDQCGDQSTNYYAYCALNANNTVNSLGFLLLSNSSQNCSSGG